MERTALTSPGDLGVFHLQHIKREQNTTKIRSYIFILAIISDFHSKIFWDNSQ